MGPAELPTIDPKLSTVTKLADGRTYRGIYCFNHGRNALGERVKVELETKTVTSAIRIRQVKYRPLRQDIEAKVLACTKCGIQIRIN